MPPPPNAPAAALGPVAHAAPPAAAAPRPRWTTDLPRKWTWSGPAAPIFGAEDGWGVGGGGAGGAAA